MCSQNVERHVVQVVSHQVLVCTWMWSDVFCPSYKGYGFWIPFPFFSTKGRAYLMNHMPPITPCLGYGDICHCKNLSDQSIPQSCEVHKSPIFLLTQNSSHHVLRCSYITAGGTRKVNDKMMERKQKAGCSFEDTCSVKIAICIFRRFQQCVSLDCFPAALSAGAVAHLEAFPAPHPLRTRDPR